MRLLLRVTLLLGLLGALAPARIAQSQTAQRCFSQTGFCVEGQFLDFWLRNGGLAAFGVPLTEQRPEEVEGQTLQVQWFERQRFELHPDNPPTYRVEIGRVGDERLQQRRIDWQTQFPRSAEQQDCRYFPETGHNLCGRFLNAWRSQGVDADGQPGNSEADNLALFGLPLSDEFTEEVEGKAYTVQWFERARFEYHPENARPYSVLLGRLGAEILSFVEVVVPGRPTLPEEHDRAISAAAKFAGLPDEPLAADRVLIYALPADVDLSPGVALMLTPRAKFLAVSPPEVETCGTEVSKHIIAGLSVVQPVSAITLGALTQPLAVGDYSVALDEGCATATLTDQDGQSFQVGAEVVWFDLNDEPTGDIILNTVDAPRSPLSARAQQLPAPPLPRPLVEPTGLISASQICQIVVAEKTSLGRVCMKVATPPRPALRAQMDNAVTKLGLTTPVVTDGLVTDVEGIAVRKRCAEALATTPRPYVGCTPSMLLAAVGEEPPLVSEGNAKARTIGVMVVLEPLDGQFFADPALTIPVALAAGPYLAADLRLPGDRQVVANVFLGRVRLATPQGKERFSPVYRGLPLLRLNEQPGQAGIAGYYWWSCCYLGECEPLPSS